MTTAVLLPSDELPLDQDSMDGMYLTFDLASEGYGLEIRYVTEIVGIQPVVAVPDLPDYMIGVLNLRGKIIPIIDVRLRFRLPRRDYDERTCIVVVQVNDYISGLVVDKVSEVIDIPNVDIEPAPTIGRKAKHYIRAMGKVGQKVKLLLDMGALMDDEQVPELEPA